MRLLRPYKKNNRNEVCTFGAKEATLLIYNNWAEFVKDAPPARNIFEKFTRHFTDTQEARRQARNARREKSEAPE